MAEARWREGDSNPKSAAQGGHIAENLGGVDRDASPTSRDKPATSRSADRALDHADAIEAALAKALEAATAAQRWDVVAQLARELEAVARRHSVNSCD